MEFPKYRKGLDPDSDAYALIGKRCSLCKEIITRYDVTKPQMVYEARNTDKQIHAGCLQYCQRKYPNVSLTELEGKIQRRKFEFQ